MTYTEKQLDRLCAFIAKAPGKCLFCDRRDVEPHHIFMGRWKRCWFFRWTLAFIVPLCPEHHRLGKDAPHRNQKRFWKKLEAALKDDKKRWALIARYRDSKVGIPEQPDLKDLLADLKRQAKKIDAENWMDREVDPEFKGRNKEGSEIWSL